jgi:hypothetical protein
VKLSKAQKENIRQLLFQRVPDSPRRSKIIALANALSDNGEKEEDYFAALYHYALKENWPDLERDYDEFVKPFASDTYMPEGTSDE